MECLISWDTPFSSECLRLEVAATSQTPQMFVLFFRMKAKLWCWNTRGRDEESECLVGANSFQDATVWLGHRPKAALVHDGHAPRMNAEEFYVESSVEGFEEFGMGERKYGERVVHRRPGYVVLTFAISIAELRK